MGSRPQAEAGQLLPLAAGPEAACKAIAPVFDAFSRGVLWLGDQPGVGSRLKLVVNHWILNSVENLAQTLAFAEALELDPRRFLELISGAPFDMQYAHWKAELMLEEDFPVAFALKLARKDIELALDAAAARRHRAAARRGHEPPPGRGDRRGLRRRRQRGDLPRRPPRPLNRRVRRAGARLTPGVHGQARTSHASARTCARSSSGT